MTETGTKAFPTTTALRGWPANTPYTSAQGRWEGWSIFDCGVREDGTPHIALQRIDYPESGEPPFADDAAAWDHVVTQARAGSRLHQMALELVDPVERYSIEARCGCWPERGQAVPL